jgi:hypothetical protein
LPRIKDIIIDTQLSIKGIANPTKRKNSFEFFGYDFMVDEDFRTWLIEVNSNPYIGIPNSYIQKLLPTMLDDMFSIVLDPVCKPGVPREARKNGYELIYSESKNINLRRSFDVDVYPFAELKQPVGRYKKYKEFQEKKKHKNKTEKKTVAATVLTFPAKRAMDDSHSPYNVSAMQDMSSRTIVN